MYSFRGIWGIVPIAGIDQVRSIAHPSAGQNPIFPSVARRKIRPMNTINRLIFISSIGALLSYSASAQPSADTAPIRFSATCRSVNDSGKIVTRNVSNNTLIRDCARENDVTNRAPLRLVYHFGGDQNGDTIEVVHRKTGEVICTKFKLLFAQESLSNDDGSETVQLVKVFSDSQSEEVGTAVIRKITNANGKVRLTGTLNYFIPVDGTNSAQICTGTFSSGSTGSSVSGIQLPNLSDFQGLGNQNQ